MIRRSFLGGCVIPFADTFRLAVLALALSAMSAGCTHVRPWERGKLAHPTMVGPNVPGPAEGHVYAVQEGAVGGGGSAESGCGCN